MVWGGSLTPHFVVCPPAKNSNVENLPPHILRLVYKEVSLLSSDPPDGIKLFPNEEDITDVQVTIEGPGKTPPPHITNPPLDLGGAQNPPFPIQRQSRTPPPSTYPPFLSFFPLFFKFLWRVSPPQKAPLTRGGSSG